MILRSYKPDDLKKLAETYTESIRVLAVPYYSPEQIAAWAPVPVNLDRWQERLSRLRTVVADKDGLIAGFVSYTAEGYLDFIFTHPGYVRSGVASRLYQRVESDLIDMGVCKVTAHVSLVARKFFEHHGFLLDLEEEVESRGVLLRRFSMHKMLLPST